MSHQPLPSRWTDSRPLAVEAVQAALAAGRAEPLSKQLAAVLEATMDGVFAISRDWRFTFANQRALQELSVSADLIGRKVLDVFPRLPEAPFWPAYQRVMATRVAESVEAYSISLNGWYEAHVAPIGDGITVFFRNIDQRKAAEAALQASNDRLRTILDSVPQMIWSYEAGTGQEYYNQPWREFTGVALGSPGAPTLSDLVHPDDRERGLAAGRASLATGEPYECEYRLKHHSGEYRWVVSRALPQRNGEGNITSWYGSCTDIHQRVLSRQAQEASETLVRSILEASADSIKMLDLAGEILFANAAATRHIAADPIGRDWLASFPEDSAAEARAALSAAQAGGVGHFTACRAVEGGAQLWWDVLVTPVAGADDRPERLVVISRDVTDQKAAEERVRWSATHDSLTGLPNRALFQECLEQAIARSRESGSAIALLLLDLNDFKLVNDTLGHDTGDALLRCFAQRLLESVRPGDFVARLGGDEFAVILEHVADKAEVEATAAALLTRLREAYLSGGRLLDCPASIGASLFPDQGSTAAELLKTADLALYAARSLGHGQLMLFEPRMRAEMDKRLSMLAIAREALGNDLILPYYQPKLDLASGRVVGFEALLRWRHSGRGIQPPETIAVAFEDLELAAEISDRMIERTVADMCRWLDEGVDFGHIAINAAAAELRQRDFADKVLSRLNEAGVPTGRLQLEVTETVFLGRGSDHIEQALRDLSREGVRIALDDFGTGYASLSHLKQFPVDLLKIDRAFVRDLEDDPSDAAIIRAVIGLGHSLDMAVVAEGVETRAQHDFLRTHGCDFGQGFLYSKAVAASQVPMALAGPREIRSAA